MEALPATAIGRVACCGGSVPRRRSILRKVEQFLPHCVEAFSKIRNVNHARAAAELPDLPVRPSDHGSRADLRKQPPRVPGGTGGSMAGSALSV
jgi:hypothetical protein